MLSPGELSPVQEPVMGEAGALRNQEWADSQAAAVMDGKKETFKRLKGADWVSSAQEGNESRWTDSAWRGGRMLLYNFF